MKRYILFLFAISIIQNSNALEVTIEGLNYFLNPLCHEATLTYGHTCSNNLDIPSEVKYNGETFVVKSMIWCAFYDHTELKSVKIPKSLESILHYYPYESDNSGGPTGNVSSLYMNPFMGCTTLESIEVDEDNPSLKSIDGVLFSQDGVGQYYHKTINYQGTGLYCYPEGKQKEAYTIPETVEWIGADAFSNNQYLYVLTMPNSLRHICQSAFEGCSRLENVYCFAENVPTTGNNVFRNTPIVSATLHVPVSSIDKYKAASSWNEFGNIVGEGEVTIDGLNYYLDSSFYTAPLTKGNTWEGELDIPSVISFYGQTYRVTSMALTAFRNNTKLTKVRIPKNLEGILHGYYTTNPYEDVPDGLISPDCMNPFIGCTALESIEVDEENPSLKSVDGVLFSQDGKGYYYYLTNSYYGTGLYCYPAGAQRESYTIPNGVEWIGSGAFGHNQYISTLTIPSSLKQICYNVFAGCNNLKDIYCYAENVPITFSEAFKDFPIASATLHVPAGSVDAYKATAPWSGFGDIVAIEEIAQEYFPEGTKWTEIRLDTKRFDSWYSKVGDEWVPNFETIEYRVQGEYTDHNLKFKKVYSNGPEWTDSLALLIYDNGYDKRVSASVLVQDLEYVLWPAEVYQFDWNIGIRLWFQDLLEANATCYPPCGLFNYGIIDEIKEGYFGGVRPLKYVDLNGKAPSDPKQPWLDYADTNGGRIIQGIGITEWNDGECLFGPPNPYSALSNYEYLPQRHYRSMLVHFESGGEVLYDVWPKKEAIEVESVTFTRDQMATIVLPTEPDASKGKYYRLDRVEGNEIIFEQELQPRAHVPYIIVPGEDFSIEVSAMELDGLRCDTASVEGISFIGTFQKEEVESQEGFYIELIDTTPDCSLSASGEAGRDVYTIGTLRAYLLVHWDDPYHPGGTKVPAEKMEIVLKDNPNSIEIVNSKSSNSKCYDLSGKMVNRKSSNSKFPRGIYIEGGKVKIY